MKYCITAVLAVMLTLLALTGCVSQTPPVTEDTVPPPLVSDTAETPETQRAPAVTPEFRLVATSRATVEICDRLGIPLVGVPALDGLPGRYADTARTGSAMAPDLEAIKLLNPTEVAGPDTLEGDLSKGYANADVPATFLNLRSVEGLYDSVAYLGGKYGAEDAARELRAEYETALADLVTAKSGREGPRVLILMGFPGAYIECTPLSYTGSLVELCGGVSVVTDSIEGL
jgi:iron complex transport system substrate-binding protein